MADSSAAAPNCRTCKRHGLQLKSRCSRTATGSDGEDGRYRGSNAADTDRVSVLAKAFFQGRDAGLN